MTEKHTRDLSRDTELGEEEGTEPMQKDGNANFDITVHQCARARS